MNDYDNVALSFTRATLVEEMASSKHLHMPRLLAFVDIEVAGICWIRGYTIRVAGKGYQVLRPLDELNSIMPIRDIVSVSCEQGWATYDKQIRIYDEFDKYVLDQYFLWASDENKACKD